MFTSVWGRVFWRSECHRIETDFVQIGNHERHATGRARACVCVCVCGGDRPFIGVFHKVSQKLFYIIFFLA